MFNKALKIAYKKLKRRGHETVPCGTPLWPVQSAAPFTLPNAKILQSFISCEKIRNIVIELVLKDLPEILSIRPNLTIESTSNLW